MTTSRDVIAAPEWFRNWWHMDAGLGRTASESYASMLSHLRFAPDPVRLELAKQLLPSLKDYAQFKAEARANAALPAPPSKDMSWRDRVRQEILAVLKEHDVFNTMEQVADDIADAMPSPDERNGFIIIPSARHEALMAAAKELISATEYTVRRRETREVLAAISASGILEGE